MTTRTALANVSLFYLLCLLLLLLETRHFAAATDEGVLPPPKDEELLGRKETSANNKEDPLPPPLLKHKQQQQDAVQLYDLNAPAYETVLTPIDFELAMELEDNPGPGSDSDWDSEAMYNLDKFEGDIANEINATTVALFIRGAPEKDSKGNGIQLNAIRDRRQLWHNGRIPYAISSQYSAYSRSVIASAMQEYAKHTCIQWTPRNAIDRDYVYVVPERGCYSMVGRTTGRQVLSLGNGCIQKGIIIHEMMHATGFFHEQSRPDRDDFISIIWHNILPGMQGQFEKYTQATIQTLGSDYDYGSIMHYGPNAFTRNGLPTIVPRRQSAIGQRTGFSKLDAWKINALYECPNYGGVYGSQSTAMPALPQPQPITVPPTLAPPIATTGQPTTQRLCRNSRPDCDQLARQGWCQRNPQWMRDHCPISCGMCPADRRMPSPQPIVPMPSSTQSPLAPAPPSPELVCEDLRVDCAELAKGRYCITAPSFTRTYCARSCGFCFVPPVTDGPGGGGNAATTPAAPTMLTLQPLGPMVTFWPPRPDQQRPPSGGVTDTPPAAKGRPPGCRDRKHFCHAWKNSGFCQGIFLSYMKKNCAATCGWC